MPLYFENDENYNSQIIINQTAKMSQHEFDKRYFNINEKEKLQNNLDMNNHQIKNLTIPTHEQDAITKGYSDYKNTKLKEDILEIFNKKTEEISNKINDQKYIGFYKIINEKLFEKSIGNITIDIVGNFPIALFAIKEINYENIVIPSYSSQLNEYFQFLDFYINEGKIIINWEINYNVKNYIKNQYKKELLIALCPINISPIMQNDSPSGSPPGNLNNIRPSYSNLFGIDIPVIYGEIEE